MSIFSLAADVCGAKRQVSADHTRAGIVVFLLVDQVRARTVAEAVRIAARQTGLFLQRAERPGVPWGLQVSVGGLVAVYGMWAPLMGPPSDACPHPSEAARIRKLWRDTDGPLAALENACKIIDVYARHARAA
ncbi:MAG: hypothetical protein WB998_04755 [Solirubrobacteraceae bacterium]